MLLNQPRDGLTWMEWDALIARAPKHHTTTYWERRKRERFGVIDKPTLSERIQTLVFGDKEEDRGNS